MACPLFTISDTLLDTIPARRVEFVIPGGVTSPAEFTAAVDAIGPQLLGSRVILLTGRGPVWGYAMLVHAAHPTPAIAVFDPRLGYVVIATHSERFTVGQVLAPLDIEGV